MGKRSVRVAGHPTSVSLEDSFWDALSDIAAARKLSVAGLVDEIDMSRRDQGLSSAIRLYVLEYYRARAKRPRGTEETF